MQKMAEFESKEAALEDKIFEIMLTELGIIKLSARVLKKFLSFEKIQEVVNVQE